ncbi:hypothetical protein H5410_001016 [Solanum commersonii]|uniref:Protein phosphatase n=1 Tax=Solanum commersonii TaxID=4109 RepID=A0A9J6AYJ2_SOLCO|nr:hypothetical protein H5410_001016 [Solanum commersonii]
MAIERIDIDKINAIDEIDIDEDLNFWDESTDVSSFINGNFKMKMEDAHFICIEEETIGVADGIGGWAKKGINSGEYSRQLVRNAELSIHKPKDQRNQIHPMEVLNEAYFNMKCQDGLFDNAHDTELLKLVCDNLVDLRELGTFSKMLARKIAEYALQKSESKSIYTPFAIDCLKVGKYRVGSQA